MKSGFLNIAISSITLTLASASLMAQAPVSPTVQPPTVIAPAPDNGQQSADPALTIRSERAAADAEPAANEEYTLGAGNQISLDFPGRPELAGKHTIGPDRSEERRVGKEC